jgi:uncharacterized membrane protein
MRTRAERRVAARYRWDRLKVSFWFTPALLALGAVLLAWAMYWLDNHIPNQALQGSRLVLSGTVDDMRTALLTMAATTLATAGLVFTLLTLPLSTVAAQYGSRLLRLFVGDRTTQSVLGMFAGTFVYCTAAALVIAPTEVQPEGPQLTATVGLYLMLGTFASLIGLVQHISTMLQAPNIAAAAGAELVDVVTAEGSGDAVRDGGRGAWHHVRPRRRNGTAPLTEAEGCPVRARKTGYIQYIDPEIILTLAREENLFVRLLRKPGHFVWRGAMVATIWPADRVDRQLDNRFRDAFKIGTGRTPTQDVEYAVGQLVEMAVRAMSPAINDPFTAMTCLDYLGEGLALFVRQGRSGTSQVHADEHLGLAAEPVAFQELLGAAFDMIRHASCDNATVLLHMLEVIDLIGLEAMAPEARQQLLRHVTLIQAESQAGDLIGPDQQAIQHRAEALQATLLGPPPAPA